jgi:hypothetical protein
MSNAPVPAAATGLPSLDRRRFLTRTSMAAVAVALPAASLAGAPDPVFAAIARASDLNQTFEATVSEVSAAQSAVLALGQGYSASVEFAGARLCSHAEIQSAFDIERFRFPLQRAKIDRAQDRLAAEFDRRAAAIRAVEIEHDLDALECREISEGDAAIAAEVEALSTVPTSLAGVAALADFMCLRRIAGGDHAVLGAASIAAACRNFISA